MPQRSFNVTISSGILSTYRTIKNPTQRYLHPSSLDYDAPDAEKEEPDEARLGPEKFAVAMQRREERRKLVAFRKAVMFCTANQVVVGPSAHERPRSKEFGAHNPYRVLLHKLTGSTIHRPRRRTAVNVWRKTQRAVIEEEVKTRAARLQIPVSGLAAARDKVAKELFAKLDPEEKARWEQQAKEEHDATTKAWKEETEGSCPTDPISRQKAIYGIVNFMQPILDLLCEATGWKATLIVGGPEPAHGGRLNVISVHSGTIIGDTKMNFGRAERLRYKDIIVPIYGQFLQRCYSPEECRARALPVEEGFEGLDSAGLDARGVNCDMVGSDNPAATPPDAPITTTTGILSMSAISTSPPSAQPTVPTALSENPQPDPQPSHTRPRSQSRGLNPASPPRPSPPLSPRSSLLLSPRPNPPQSPHPPHPLQGVTPGLSRGPSPLPSLRSLSPSPLVTHALSRGPSPLPSLRSLSPPPVTHALSRQPRRLSSRSRSLSQGITPSDVSIALGQKRRADADFDGPPRSKRNRTIRVASESTPLSISAATRAAGVVKSVPIAKRTLTTRRTQPSALETSPSTRRHGAPLSTRATRTQPSALETSASTRSRGAPSTRATRSTRVTANTSLPRNPAGSLSTASFPKLRATHDAPSWFANALTMLQCDDQDLGHSWRTLVGLWASFEVKESYGRDVVGKLTAKHRPTMLKDWIQRARSTTWRPAISNVAPVKADFSNWWTSLQPEWRVEDGGVLDMTKVDGSWEPLRQPGVNGLLSAIAGLFFWGLAARRDRAASKEWSRFVDDCIVALNGLLDSS